MGTSLDELIARLEAATEGGRELDCLIAVHPATPNVGVVKNASLDILLSDQNTLGPEPLVCDSLLVPLYTTLVDAALTLVPEGMPVDIHIGPSAIYTAAKVYWKIQWFDEQGRRCTRYEPSGEAGEPKDGKIHRNTPALAVCIAALRARAIEISDANHPRSPDSRA